MRLCPANEGTAVDALLLIPLTAETELGALHIVMFAQR